MRQYLPLFFANHNLIYSYIMVDDTRNVFRFVMGIILETKPNYAVPYARIIIIILPFFHSYTYIVAYNITE